MKASVRGKVEYSFRVIQCQFGFTKVRHKKSKNITQIMIQIPYPSCRWQDEYCCKERLGSAPLDWVNTQRQPEKDVIRILKQQIFCDEIDFSLT